MKKILLAFVLLASTSLGTFQPAYAACTSSNASKNQVLEGAGATGGNCNSEGFTNIVRTIVEILSIIVGVAAIIMIIVAGFKYLTSGGDSGRISSAKNTLIYALIGLVIAALAQVIVNVVLTTADKSTLPTCSTAKEKKDPDKYKCAIR